jgi:hypothetical protein
MHSTHSSASPETAKLAKGHSSTETLPLATKRFTEKNTKFEKASKSHFFLKELLELLESKLVTLGWDAITSSLRGAQTGYVLS